jgi:uncharacterized protein
MSLSRREFMRTSTLTAVGAVGAAAAPALAAPASAPVALPVRSLGRTGERVSALGFGMAPLGSDNTTPEEATRVVSAGIDMGVTFIDVAPVYGNDEQKYGNAETKLRETLRTRRKEVFLVTKVNAERPTRDGVLRQIDESLKRMEIDRVDLVHIHNLGDFDMEKVFTPEGTLGGLLEAKKRGLIRYIGASGHMRPARFVPAIETGEIDVCMTALNFADRYNYDFEGLVLPAAARHRCAMVAMKVLGGARDWQYDARTAGTLADYHERAIRYSLGLPGVACAVIGFANEKELRQAVSVVRDYRPLTASERGALLEQGRRVAADRKDYYGPVTG